jgi:hypothetical protein
LLCNSFGVTTLQLLSSKKRREQEAIKHPD